MSIVHTFGKNVRLKRLELGLSQEKLAEKSRLHRTYIGAVERSQRNITLVNAQKIASALGTDLSSLLR